MMEPRQIGRKRDWVTWPLQWVVSLLLGVQKKLTPSSTWNYVVNDSPFENQFAINLLAGSLFGSYRT